MPIAETPPTVVPCPVCNGLEPELYLDGDDSEIDPKSVGSSRTLLSHGRLLRCTSCGVAYRSFRPDARPAIQLVSSGRRRRIRSRDAKPSANRKATPTDNREARALPWISSGCRLRIRCISAPDAGIRLAGDRRGAVSRTIQAGNRDLGTAQIYSNAYSRKRRCKADSTW